MRKVSERQDPCDCPLCASVAKLKVSAPAFKGEGGGWFGRASDKGKIKTTTIDTSDGSVKRGLL